MQPDTPYNDRLTGDYYTLQIEVTDKATPIAHYEESLYVNVVVPEKKQDGSDNVAIFVGDATGQYKQRLPLTEDGDKPVSNLNKIWLRTVLQSTDAGYTPAFVFVEVRR